MKGCDQKGFTLIEIMIAVSLLAFGILAAATMQIGSLGGNNTALRVTTASALASGAMEQIMSMDFAALTDVDNDLAGGLDHNTAATADGTIPLPTATGNYGNYTIFYNVCAGPLTNTRRVRVIVTTPEKGVQKDLSFDYLAVP